ncbi:hypothetical protein PT974_12532 [Cladobotryum mycophilum]|uniref:Protein kinase domain-containing protein n=1 Tax=Cladobotryum mycophilum TaxID=491253 RepID=A0ABR0S9C9_9HYPO
MSTSAFYTFRVPTTHVIPPAGHQFDSPTTVTILSHIMYAPLFQLNWKNSDLVSATSNFTSTATTSPTSSGGTCFLFGTRLSTAIGHITDADHQYARGCLAIQPSTTTQFITDFLALLPNFVQTHLRRRFPEWYSADKLVLKSQKPKREVECNSESSMQKILQPLQRIYISRYLSVAQCHDTWSHIMSDVWGLNVCDTDEYGEEAIPVFRQTVQETLLALASFGYQQGDLKLDNLHIVGDEMVAVDLERVCVFTDATESDKFIKHDIAHLMGQCRDYQENPREGWTDF